MSIDKLNVNTALLELESRKKFTKNNRVWRMLRNPFKMFLPYFMRKVGSQRDIQSELFWGKVFSGVLPEAISSMVWRYGFFDYDTTKNILLELKEGDVFVDIGAHFGYFSLLASEIVGRAGRVVSIEALPSTYERLKINLENNNSFGNYTHKNIAAFNTLSRLKFNDYGVVYSSLNSAFGLRNSKLSLSNTEIEVPADRLDNILKSLDVDKIDVVKIDAESSEFFVIEGMKKILENNSPVLIVELGDKGVTGAQKTTREIIDLLDGFGYQGYKRNNGEHELVPKQQHYAYINMIFKKRLNH